MPSHRTPGRATTLLARSLAFAAVGAMGIGVQLGTLAVLARVLDGADLAATALAVEAALLHNFLWHERWTWRDRPCTGWRRRVARLTAFHLTNGAISLATNLLVTAAGVRRLGCDVLIANAFAIVTAATLNFLAGDRVVFRGALRAAGPVAHFSAQRRTRQPVPSHSTAE